MIKLTESLKQWLIKNHPDIIHLIQFGHLELFTKEMQKEYLSWCKTDEGKQYLKGGEKYKIKRWLGQLGAIKPFLNELDLRNYQSSDVNPGDEYFYIKYGEQVLATSKREDIQAILNWCRFDDIIGYDLNEYKKCD